MRSVHIALSLLLAAVPVSAFCQQPKAAIASSNILSQISMFNYEEGPKSSLELRPTPIGGSGEGKATVEYEKGNANIRLSVYDLPPPPKLGPYTTYILWALTPDGRAASQGVVAGIDGGKGKLDTEYAASQFALIVTAEPHFAVTAPSDMIVLYNVADKVKGAETKVTSLTERADYSGLTPIAVDKNRPAELVAAEYSVAAAKAAGAQQYASTLYSNAEQKLAEAEKAIAAPKHSDRKNAPELANAAVLAGEDARREGMAGKVRADAAAAQAAAAAKAAQAAAADEAVRGRAAAKQDLMARLNQALPTKETDRGLVSEIGGVQFATGTANLNASARESLSRFAGIVASYPDLKLQIEGHTDSTGSEQTNQELSIRRAIAVRDYLIAQRVVASNIDAQGLASAHPLADNATADGRARNRRVEIVISGGPLAAN